MFWLGSGSGSESKLSEIATLRLSRSSVRDRHQRTRRRGFQSTLELYPRLMKGIAVMGIYGILILLMQTKVYSPLQLRVVD